MSPLVFLVVLGAAALHATWNAVVKGGRDTLLTTVLVAGSAALIAGSVLPFLPPLAPAAWPFLAASGVLEITYYGLIAAAYRHADMSRAYPLMRGTPPLIVGAVSTLFLGLSISPIGWLGIVLISAGILTTTLATQTRSNGRGLGFALLNAGVIAGYTLVDGLGVQVAGNALTYAMWIFVLTGVPLAIWALARRPDVVAYCRTHWRGGLIGGFGTLSSYGLVLWAMTQAPVPMVAALRETSILFGTAIAIVVLREKVSPLRIGAVVIIAVGAGLLRLA